MVLIYPFSVSIFSFVDLKVVWAELAPNSPIHNKFSARLIEDSNLGLMSYVDYLCNMHIKIQAKIK